MDASLTKEQAEVLDLFYEMLKSVTADGGRKRAAGLKPSWKVDTSHRAAIFSHLNKYEHGERVDPDSGAHPFVHLAWRALAIAWQDKWEREKKEEHMGLRPPVISTEQDAVADALDHIAKTPLCGKLGCTTQEHYE